MPEIFREKDPRGFIVFCEQKQWEQHIINESGHEIMNDNIQAVIETIRKPDYIYESHNPTEERRREMYFKFSPGATYYPRFQTLVVSELNGGSAEVITTYPVPTGKYSGTKGEAIYNADDK